MSLFADVLEAFDDIPAEIARPVLTLLGGIVRVVLAGDDPTQREAALMRTAEGVKRELDRVKFGEG